MLNNIVLNHMLNKLCKKHMLNKNCAKNQFCTKLCIKTHKLCETHVKNCVITHVKYIV